MDAARRAAYLDALGVTRWVLRDAAPSTSATAAVSPQPEAAAEAAVVTEPVVAAEPERTTNDDVTGLGWEHLEARVAGCRQCALCETRTQTVFGVGDRQAELMIIGEAPGADEDRQGEPFVGRAGQLLTAMLAAIGLKRDQVYIANVLKCRPPGNRNPGQQEAAACRAYLDRQIALVAPRLILSVGKVSAHHLLQSDAPVGRLRGRTQSMPGSEVPVQVTYHPAYLLRQPAEKAKAWADLQQVARVLEADP